MIESGTLLQNRYRVVKQIGQGGMGAVYFATDERFGSTVAVKQTFFDDPALRKAFEREAHLLNHLRHTALPKVSDHFTESDGQFLVMDFIEGADISELLQQRKGAFPLADVLRWADELLDALDYLHTHEPAVVHRDIKPQNLKLTSRGQIVLLDFGLAKGTSSQMRAGANATAASVFGYSRNYAPLEQIQGTGTDARSDLYSLGATLYHLLTGTAPVDALTRASAIINGQPDPLRPAHAVHAQVPPAVSEILRRSMAQNAAHRQPTAADMRAALRRVANTLSDTAYEGVTPFTQAKSATDMPTVLESASPATYGPQSPSDTRATTMLRPPATSQGETTFVDAYGVRRRQTITPVALLPDTPRARRSTGMLVGIAVAVVVACALVAFPLMRRNTNSGAQSETPLSSTPAASAGEAQPAAPNTTPEANASGVASGATSDSQPTPTPSPSPGAPAADGTPATGGQPANGNAEPTANSDPNADKSKSAPVSTVASADSSGLVIQSSTPNSQPGTNSAAAEYDAQRAEALRKKREQQEQQLKEQREREQQPQYMAAPEHYGLERSGPPPSDGGGSGFRPPPPPPPGGRRPPLR